MRDFILPVKRNKVGPLAQGWCVLYIVSWDIDNRSQQFRFSSVKWNE